MNKTHLFLRERYGATHWPYYGLLETKYHTGETFDADIKELRQKEMIKPTAGLNGWLIELINTEELWV